MLPSSARVNGGCRRRIRFCRLGSAGASCGAKMRHEASGRAGRKWPGAATWPALDWLSARRQSGGEQTDGRFVGVRSYAGDIAVVLCADSPMLSSTGCVDRAWCRRYRRARFRPTKSKEKKTTAACTTGISRWLIELKTSRPTPGQEKTVSITTTPLSRKPNSSPIIVTNGISALRKAWPMMTVRCANLWPWRW